jgi:hypothetical protein
MYCQLSGKKYRSIPIQNIINILSKYKLTNIEIISKNEGKEKKEKKRKIRDNIITDELKDE